MRTAATSGRDGLLGGVGDLLDDGGNLLDQFGVVARVRLGEADHRLGDRELDVLERTGTGDADRLAGLVLRPDAAVLTERGADHGHRLAAERALAVGPRRPVD